MIRIPWGHLYFEIFAAWTVEVRRVSPRHESMRVTMAALEILMNTMTPKKVPVLDRAITKIVFVNPWFLLISNIMTRLFEISS